MPHEEISGEVPNSFTRFLRWWLLVSVAVLLAVGAYVFFESMSVPSANRAILKDDLQSVPVAVITARRSELNVYISALGNVMPFSTVAIKTRVNGQRLEAIFKDGQIVNQADLRAVIGPRPFQVQLAQVEGQMIREKEPLNNARLDLDHYRGTKSDHFTTPFIGIAPCCAS